MIDVYAGRYRQRNLPHEIIRYEPDSNCQCWEQTGCLSPMEYKHSLGIRIQDNFKTHEQAEWSTMSVKRILGNEVYTGTLVQRLLGIDTRTSPNEEKVYPLSGLVVCGDCGGNDDQTGCSGRRKGICLCLLDSYGAGFSAVQAAVEAAKGKTGHS